MIVLRLAELYLVGIQFDPAASCIWLVYSLNLMIHLRPVIIYHRLIKTLQLIRHLYLGTHLMSHSLILNVHTSHTLRPQL